MGPGWPPRPDVRISPGSEEHYYWVIACNRGCCSEVDNEHPVTRIGD